MLRGIAVGAIDGISVGTVVGSVVGSVVCQQFVIVFIENGEVSVPSEHVIVLLPNSGISSYGVIQTPLGMPSGATIDNTRCYFWAVIE